MVGCQRRAGARLARRRPDLEQRDAGRPAARRPRPAGINPSPHRKGSAYIAYYRYLLGDWAPYIYRTDDYGKTWARLTDGSNGIPAETPVRVVREDPDRAGLLYAGTEFGMYLSWDNGGHWQRWQLDLPVTPITDIRLHRKDLVVATMGRGFWILDDVARLHQWRAAPTSATLFAPREATRARLAVSAASSKAPEYPGAVVNIDYALPAEAESVTIAIVDAVGREVRAFTSAPAAPVAAPAQGMRAPGRARPRAAGPRRSRGTHRFIWDMRLPGLPTATNPEGSAFGPLVLPGSYSVRLTVDGAAAGSQPLQIRLDPRVVADGVTQADLEAQHRLLTALRDTTARALALSAALSQVAAGSDARAQQAAALHAQLVTAGGNYPQPMLVDQLANVWRMANQADQPPGRDAVLRLDDLTLALTALEKQAATLR